MLEDFEIWDGEYLVERISKFSSDEQVNLLYYKVHVWSSFEVPFKSAMFNTLLCCFIVACRRLPSIIHSFILTAVVQIWCSVRSFLLWYDNIHTSFKPLPSLYVGCFVGWFCVSFLLLCHRWVCTSLLPSYIPVGCPTLVPLYQPASPCALLYPRPTYDSSTTHHLPPEILSPNSILLPIVHLPDYSIYSLTCNIFE